LSTFVGIDLGTSGCRGATIDNGGELIAEARLELPPSKRASPGASEQQPDDWWSGVQQILSRLLEESGGKTIRAIAVDATSSTLLLCDERGEPLSAGLMYDDSRGGAWLPEIRCCAPANSPVLSASSSLAKLLYLSDSLKQRPFLALHQADWIMGRLCGHYPMSDENNCLKLGYDPQSRRWPAWLTDLGIPPGCLPRVFPTATRIGTISPAVAAQAGLSDDVAVVTGTTDSNAAFLATGADQVGDAVSSLGSTLVLKILSDKPVFAAEYGVYSHRLGDRWLVSGASNTGGAVCRAFFSQQEITRHTRRISPERPTGLDYYPLLRPGERFPVNDSGLSPRLSPRPDDDARFFQAILEGIARIEQAGYALLQRLGAPRPERVISVGGGAVNEPWRAMRQALLGVPVVRAQRQEAAYGSALLARRGFDSDG
jgi:sugar (pentulose or hexulose) kinase